MKIFIYIINNFFIHIQLIIFNNLIQFINYIKYLTCFVINLIILF